MHRLLLRLPLLLLLPLLLGCGYHTGQVTGGEGCTIAVPVFENRTYRRELERDLTRAVQEEVQRRTRFRLVEERDGPDIVLRGALVRASESVLSLRDSEEIRESSVRLTVQMTVEDSRSGEVTVTKRSIQERRSYAPVKGESIRTAENAVIRTLAEKIVYALESDW